MHKIYFTIQLILVLFIVSCSKQNESQNPGCDKLMSLEEAENLMQNSRNNKLESSESIEESLIGEWALVGIVPGWFGFEPIKECLILDINHESIVIKNLDTGVESSTPWEIIPFEVNNYEGFYLDTNEELWHNRIGMDVFSENHMYGSGRVEDGDIYIYEKKH